MLQTKINRFRTGHTNFYCPKCSTKDAANLVMPVYCYNCLKSYKFDVNELDKNVEKRIEYHKGYTHVKDTL